MPLLIRVFLLSFVFGGLCLLPTPGMAQREPIIESLEVALLPEFDQPAVLVIYQVRLSPETPLPTKVELPIPARVGEPHAVAMRTSYGALLVTDYTRRVEGDWATITVETDNLEVWLEFYDDLTIDDQKRSHSFVWPGGVDIGEFAVEVQEPVGSSDFQVTPVGEVSTDEDGLTNHQIRLGPQSKMSTLSIDLTYIKSEPGLTSERLFLEGALSLESLEVALLPEYDRPAILVIYRAQLPASTSLPATVSLPIPAAVGEPHAVAVLGERDSLLSTEYTRRVLGKWATISIDADSRGVWLEYYSELTFDGENRSYTFLWPGGIDIGSFMYHVQQPVGASKMTITPPGEPRIGDDGRQYYHGDLGPISVSSTISISLSYTNPSSELSVEAIFPGSSLVRPEATRGGTPNLSVWLPWFLGGAGFILLVVGAFLYLRLVRVEKAIPVRRRRRSARKRAGKTDQEMDASPVFCHHCGTQASVSDRFCRQCGARLRN